MEKVEEGRPLGEMLIWRPVRGAEAVKKICWERACGGGRLVCLGGYGVFKEVGVMGGGRGEGGPILLGCRGSSHRIVPCFLSTITYWYITR